MSEPTDPSRISSVLSDLPDSRKRRCRKSKSKTKSNYRKKIKLNSSNPAKKTATERAGEFDKQHSLIGLINDKIECKICKSQFSNTKDTVDKHIKGPRHQKALQDKIEEEKNQKSIIQFLKNKIEVDSIEKRLRSEEEAWRIHVVQKFFNAGIPISKIDDLRDILENNSNYKLSSSNNLMYYSVDCLKLEFNNIKQMIGDSKFCVIFDGTSYYGEVMCCVIRFWHELKIIQKVISFKHFDKHLEQRGLAGFIIKSLQQCDIFDSNVIYCAHDAAAVNLKAVRNLQEVTLLKNACDGICWCHTLSNTGKKALCPELDKFLSAWQSLFAHSPKARNKYAECIGPCPYISNYTRWFVKYEVLSKIAENWSQIRKFIDTYAIQRPGASINALRDLMGGSLHNIIKLQLFVIVEYALPMIKACYFLEGDESLLPFTYDILQQVKQKLTPNTPISPKITEIIDSFGPVNTPMSKEMVSSYIKKVFMIIKPMYDYFSEKLKEVSPSSTNEKKRLKEHAFYRSILLAKFARLLDPSRIADFNPDFNYIKKLYLPIIPFIEIDINTLQIELNNYKTLSEQVVINRDPGLLFSFWLRHSIELPTWFKLFQHLSLCQPSSGAVERAIATFNSVSSGKENALEETIEAAVILRHNFTHN